MPQFKKKLTPEEERALAEKGGWKMGAYFEVDQIEQTEENGEQHRAAVEHMINRWIA